ncbi:zinc ABC transporter substrate-binding protein [Methanoculleus taiwanensis]|uniref:Zinc ABC transporter substrate-binding protein n=1 Tax=Methanoculleus taiwanensis TaxID=1550565 RepID=A0A498H0U7_9EURY|nr:zinc ABC transporter substrate-binding protein [Methanoculleus taiwanensis]RXE55977.1 zinc ABC transporter substrate-binding protein [Methanoculleus taiwanensis]
MISSGIIRTPVSSAYLPSAVLAALFLLAIAAGCTGVEQPDTPGDTITVAVTIPPQAEFVERVGGDRVRVVVMVPPGASPHTYEPTPGDLTAVSRAAMYAKVGSGIEFERAWMDKITGLNPAMLVVDCSKGVDLIEADPHIWTSPRNAGIMVEEIYAGLAAVDPEHQEYYRQNADAYLQELESLDRDIRQAVEESGTQKIMVYHPAWTYFAEEYGLTQVPIEEEGKEPSPQTLSRLIEEAKAEHITVIFAEPEFSTRSAEVIAAEVDGRVVLVSPLARNYTANMQTVAEAFTATEEA